MNSNLTRDVMKTYALCGSMRFEKEMKEIAYFLETQNSSVQIFKVVR